MPSFEAKLNINTVVTTACGALLVWAVTMLVDVRERVGRLETLDNVRSERLHRIESRVFGLGLPVLSGQTRTNTEANGRSPSGETRALPLLSS